jgi:uncharacterized protein (TIGR02145 family)
LKELGTVTDVDGHVYQTIKIDDQIWMAENLNVSSFRNGYSIPEVKTSDEWKRAWDKKQAVWCYYNNNFENGSIYGKIYNYWAISDIRGIAPDGWHMPDSEEWKSLDIIYSEERGSLESGKGWISSVGGLLKSKGTLQEGTGLWNEPNRAATNVSGLSLLPGGSRNSDGSFTGIGNEGRWWTYPSVGAVGLEYNDSTMVIGLNFLTAGMSVRCVKD